MVKRWAAAALFVPLLAMLVVTPATASHGATMTIADEAKLVPKTPVSATHVLLEVSGTYSCGQPSGGIDPSRSGFGFNVTQFQKNGVVTGGGGLGGDQLICDGAVQSWTQQITASNSDTGQQARWKGGKAIAQGGMGVCNSDNSDCAGAGFNQAIRLVR